MAFCLSVQLPSSNFFWPSWSGKGEPRGEAGFESTAREIGRCVFQALRTFQDSALMLSHQCLPRKTVLLMILRSHRALSSEEIENCCFVGVPVLIVTFHRYLTATTLDM